MKKLWLALVGAVLTTAAAVPAHATPRTMRVCDASACYIYANIGTSFDPIWVLLYVEDRGGPNVN